MVDIIYWLYEQAKKEEEEKKEKAMYFKADRQA